MTTTNKYEQDDARDDQLRIMANDFIHLTGISRTREQSHELWQLVDNIAAMPAADVAFFCFLIRDAHAGVALTQFVNRVRWSL